ncbi:hypothetical protein HAX54_050830, partial [Datura stramonium]|nr:hypothetical protein [Datura stramonium]
LEQQVGQILATLDQRQKGTLPSDTVSTLRMRVIVCDHNPNRVDVFFQETAKEFLSITIEKGKAKKNHAVHMLARHVALLVHVPARHIGQPA